MKTLLLFTIRLYQIIISPVLHLLASQFFAVPGCRYYPSCSEYAARMIKRHGVLPGAIKTCRRLSRCHLFGGG